MGLHLPEEDTTVENLAERIVIAVPNALAQIKRNEERKVKDADNDTSKSDGKPASGKGRNTPQVLDAGRSPIAMSHDSLLVEPWDDREQMTTPAAPTDEEVANYVVSHRQNVPESVRTDEDREVDRIVALQLRTVGLAPRR